VGDTHADTLQARAGVTRMSALTTQNHN